MPRQQPRPLADQAIEGLAAAAAETIPPFMEQRRKEGQAQQIIGQQMKLEQARNRLPPQVKEQLLKRSGVKWDPSMGEISDEMVMEVSKLLRPESDLKQQLLTAKIFTEQMRGKNAEVMKNFAEIKALGDRTLAESRLHGIASDLDEDIQMYNMLNNGKPMSGSLLTRKAQLEAAWAAHYQKFNQPVGPGGLPEKPAQPAQPAKLPTAPTAPVAPPNKSKLPGFSLE